VYQANGKAAWQTVFHYHMHLVPRHDGDGMALSWPAKNPPREKTRRIRGGDPARARLGRNAVTPPELSRRTRWPGVNCRSASWTMARISPCRA